jgi:hypothetical protein
MTQTISSSFPIYQEGKRKPLYFSATDYVRPPCAIACFPKEIMFPPRSLVECGYNIDRWSTMPRGGHLAASEELRLLAADLHAFFQDLRLQGA